MPLLAVRSCGSDGEVALRQMDDLHIGDRVTLRERAYIVRGISPISVTPCRVHLEDSETGEEVETDADDLQDERSESGSRSIS